MTLALFEPFSGIAGDMTVAAFLDLGLPFETLEEGLAALPLTGYRIRSERTRRQGFAATTFVVDVEERHPHRTLADVTRVIEEAGLPDRVTGRALRIFGKLARTEAAAHGTSPEEVHFHEVGAVDAIVDIVGTCLALEHFDVDEVKVTRVRAGTGETECRHGRIPVPAPATLRLLAGLPLSLVEGEGETVTPTGAAILAALASPLRATECLVLERTGLGAGQRDDTALPNVLRVSVGRRPSPPEAEEVVEIRASVDDTSPEILAYAADRVRDAGALEVYLTPVMMKKGRPGALLTALARPSDVAGIELVILRETSTFGVRRSPAARTVLTRDQVTVRTPFGEVRVKRGLLGEEVLTAAPEYEDCARRAAECGVPIRAVYDAAQKALQ